MVTGWVLPDTQSGQLHRTNGDRSIYSTSSRVEETVLYAVCTHSPEIYNLSPSKCEPTACILRACNPESAPSQLILTYLLLYSYLTHGSWIFLWPTQLLILRLQKRSLPWKVFIRRHMELLTQTAQMVRYRTLSLSPRESQISPWGFMAFTTGTAALSPLHPPLLTSIPSNMSRNIVLALTGVQHMLLAFLPLPAHLGTLP